MFINIKFSHWKVNGFENNKNDITIVTAFRHVVTVTATKAPQVLIKASTAWTPKNPESEKKNMYI